MAAVVLALWGGTVSALEIKTTILKAGCLFLAGLLGIKALFGGPDDVRFHPLLFPILTYGCCMLFGYALSNRSSLNSDAFFPQFCGVVFFFLFVATMPKEKLGFILALIQVLTGVVSIYGILQFFYLDPYPWYDLEGRFRVVSFFGNKNVFGAFLILSLPLTFHMALHGRSWPGRIASAGITFTGMTALILSGSRGGLLSLVLIGLVGGIFSLRGITVPANARLKVAAVAMAVLAGSALAWLLVPDLVRADYLNLRTDAMARPSLYRIAWEVISRHPFAGVGPGNFVLAHPLNKTHRLTEKEPEITLDNAHNELLGTWLDFGLPAVLIFIGWVTWMLLLIRKERAVAGDPARRNLLLMLTWSIANYLLYGMATEATRYTTSIFCFWLVAGIGFVSLSDGQQRGIRLPIAPFRAWWAKAIFLPALALAMGFGSFGIVKDFRAEMFLWSGMFGQKGDLAQSQPFLEEATRLKPKSVEAWYSRSYVLFSLGRYEEALEGYSLLAALAPNYADLNHNLAAAYYRKQDWPETIRHAEKSVGLFPDHVQSLVLLAFCNYYLQQPRIAYAYVERALTIDPGNVKIRGLRAELDGILLRR